MRRRRIAYVCSDCGASHPKWEGRCSACGAWNSLREIALSSEVSDPTPGRDPGAAARPPVRLSEIDGQAAARVVVGIGELDRVLGGGLVPGALVLLAGEPGIGKSTLALQAAARLCEAGGAVLYASAEESAEQVALRATRMGIAAEGLYVHAETALTAVLEAAREMRPRALVVDSIQSVHADDLDSAAGSVAQVRECAVRLLRAAKTSGMPVLLVGHVTKTGAIAGPRVLEHMVDAVLYLDGDRYHAYRILRTSKNRYGPTHEVGVFEMRGEGLVEVANPSATFLAERLPGAPGSAVTVAMEGSRPLLCEVQALVSQTAADVPRRTANGADFNRLLLLSAVLARRVGLPVGGQDVFVNVVGGLRVYEPAADLAIAAAIASSLAGVAVPADTVLLGEIGLSGELRTVSQLDRRLAEAGKLGFRRAVVPGASTGRRAGGRSDDENGIATAPARTLRHALETVLGGDALPTGRRLAPEA